MSRIRLLFAWLVLAALPLQGMAAASMLFCGMGTTPKQVTSVAGSDHAHATHSHAADMAVEQPATDPAHLPDSSHTCGICASCCSTVALTEPARPLAAASVPQIGAAGPPALLHARTAALPDKPPRA